MHFRIASKEYYIQVVDDLPSDKRLNNEYDALIKVPNSFKKIIVINRPFLSYHDEKGVLLISLEEFLLNKNSLDL